MIRVPGFGPESAKIMIVGEAPGAEEERQGRPFVGSAGQLLRNFLLQSGIDPTSVYYTNICKYRPPKNDISQWFDNGVPREEILEGCQELQQEILSVSPNVVLVCGSHPLQMLCGKGHWNKKFGAYTGIQDWRGSILESTLVWGQKCLPSYHPSYILREGYADHGVWLCDLARLKAQSDFPEIVREADQKTIVIDPRGEERHYWKAELLRSKLITFDIEYVDNKLICVGMTNSSDKAIVFATDRPGDVEFISDILLSGIPLCAQNAMFDCSILEYWYGIRCMQHIQYDTMIAAHAANIELAKSLDFLASLYTDQPFWKEMVDWKKVRKGEQPLSDVYRYNAIDTWVTHAIMQAQLQEEFGRV